MHEADKTSERSTEEPAADCQRQAERQLPETGEYLHSCPSGRSRVPPDSIVESLDGFIYVCSQEYRLEFMNDRLIARIGYDATGEFCYRALYEQEAVCPWCAGERVFKGETVHGEIRNPIDGHCFYVVNTPLYHRNGALFKQVFMVDITDRMQAETALQRAHDNLESMLETRAAGALIKNLELTKAVEEQKRMAEALRESEEKYRSVVDHVGIGVTLISRNMEVLTLNNMMKKWFPNIDVAKKPICYEVFNSPPSGAICSYCPTCRTLQDGQVHEVVTRTPSGSQFVNYRIISTPVRDKFGSIIAAIEMVEDITESKRMQERLHESEIKYRTIFETTAAATIIVEEDTTISLVNQEFERLSGFSRKDIEGCRSWTEFVPKDDLARLLGYHRSRRLDPNGTPRNYEFRFLSRSGDAHAAFITATMLPGTTRSIVSILDVTDQKRAEDALKQTNDYLENVFENSPDPIGIVDKHGKFILWNKMAAEFYGYSSEELCGKSCFDLYADKDELARMLSHLRQHESVKKWEIQMKRKDGRVAPCELSIGLLHDGTHRVLGSVCVARDLSEIREVLRELQTSNERLRLEVAVRKRAEEELSKYRDHLQDLVRERTEALAQTNAQLIREIEERKRMAEALQEASEKQKFFAYSVAHDLKSPAVGIHGLTRRLHKQYRHIFDDKGRMYCDQILKASEHVAALVEKLNLYIATKEAPLSVERIDFGQVIEIVREEFSAQLTLRQIEWTAPEDKMEIRADRLSLLRVLRNLVDNALKYGGEHLSRIRIDCEETADFHVFTVSDNGRGLQDADLERVFRPFQRHETSRGVEGTGLGLTVVKEIAEQHRGRVWVETRNQEGTTFCFSIAKGL